MSSLNPQTFPQDSFVVLDDQEPMFAISGSSTSITLTMEESVTGIALNSTGFRLIGLRSTPVPLRIGPIDPGDIDFLGNWISFPASLPVVTNIAPGVDTIEWTTLADADPISNASIVINLTFIDPIFDDGFELGNTAAWSETVSGP